MSTTIVLPINNMVRLSYPTSEPWDTIDTEQKVYFGNYDRIYYCKIQNLAASYALKKIESVKFKMTGKAGSYWFDDYHYVESTRWLELYFWAITENWDPLTINPLNKPADEYEASWPGYNSAFRIITGNRSFNRIESVYSIINIYGLNELREILNYGFWFSWNPDAEAPEVTDITPSYFISKGTDIPALEIVFSDDNNTLDIDTCAPSSGFMAKYSANTYTWSVKPTDFSVQDPTVVTAKFRYRADSSSQYTEINCGSALSYTMPANTIETNSFQWQVEITDSSGNVSTSNWFTISTEEALSTATIVTPKNTVIDGSDVNRFEWLHNISTGTAQTKADLQYSSDSGSTWTQFATSIGSATYSNIAANTFNAGTYLWRVRTYNTDNVAGSWSEVKPFTVIAKPHVYAVTSEQNPKPKVSWQGEGQQAFRVYIDNVFDSEVVFGTADNYTLPIYLDDGTYTVNVIVQNNYGLWSNPGTAPINVTNTPGTSMVLVPVYESDGLRLMWTEVLSYAYYIVYRDNIPIAKIRTNEFKDYTALGQHTYFIRGIYASSKFYGLSNVLETDTSIGKLMITDLESEISLSIEQNDSSFAELSITDSVNNTSVYISAADYPINEISHFKRKYISFSCAFVKNGEDALLFRTMLGKLVCIKTPAGTSVVGNLLEQRRNENYFYEKYSCSLNQTNYEEGIQL